LLVIFREFEQTTEAAKTTHDTGAICAFYTGFDLIDKGIAGIDILTPASR